MIGVQPPTNAALRLAVEVGLISAVEDRHGAITAQELAQETGMDELLIGTNLGSKVEIC